MFKVRGKKPKLYIYCCDINFRNEMALGHETGHVSLWRLDLKSKRCQFIVILAIDDQPIR